MKKHLIAGSACTLIATASWAGGIDRSGQSVGLIFSETGASGSYAQLSFGNASPEANGSFTYAPVLPGALAPLAGTSGTASPLDSYTQLGVGFKKQINDAFSLSFIYEQPFGADVVYASGPPFFGGKAVISSDSFTVLGRYELSNGFSVHGGVRALAVEGEIFTIFGGTLPASLVAEADYEFGSVLGVAYERPDIALRVALTYASAIDLTFTGTEATLSAADPNAPVAPLLPVVDTTFGLEFPESVNLDFQSGVAKDTLVFGTIRWVGWGGFNLTTDGSGVGGGAGGAREYVNFDDDTTTYTVGVGRRLTDELSLAVSYTYEAAGSMPSTTALAPTTGLKALTVSGSYDLGDGMTLSGGVTYGKPGDQIVENALAPAAVSFDDNKVFGIGLRVGIAF